MRLHVFAMGGAEMKAGNSTLDAIEKYDKIALLDLYANANREFFKNLVRKRPELAKFESGWINRVNDYV